MGQALQAVGETDFLRGAEAEGGEGNVHIPHPPGNGEALPVLREENVHGQAGTGSREAGEQDGRRRCVYPDASGQEGNETVRGSQVDRSIPGDGAGVGGEGARVNAVIGPELFPSAFGKDIPDDGGAGGEPELVSVRGEPHDFHPVHEPFRFLLRKRGQALAGPGEYARGTGMDTVHIIGRKCAVLRLERLPVPVAAAAEYAVAGRGEP